MLININYSNFLEGIVNGVLEVETQGKDAIAIKRKQNNKSVEVKKSSVHDEKEICIETTTPIQKSESNNHESVDKSLCEDEKIDQSSPKPLKSSKSKKQLKRRTESLKVSIPEAIIVNRL